MYDIEDKCVDYVLKESGESSMSDRAVRLFFFSRAMTRILWKNIWLHFYPCLCPNYYQ